MHTQMTPATIEQQYKRGMSLFFRLIALGIITGLLAFLNGCAPQPTAGIQCGGKDTLCPDDMICVDNVCVDQSNEPATCKTDVQCVGGRICGQSGRCEDPAIGYTVKLKVDNIGTNTAEFSIEASQAFQGLQFEVLDVEHHTAFGVQNYKGTINLLFSVNANGLKPNTQYTAWVYLNWNGPGWQKWDSAYVTFTTNPADMPANDCDAERTRLHFESPTVYRECVNYSKSGIARGIFEQYVIDEVTVGGQKRCLFHNVTFNGQLSAFQANAEDVSIDDPNMAKPHWYFRSIASPEASEAITECWPTM